MVWQALVTHLLDSAYGALENLLTHISERVTFAIFLNFNEKMFYLKNPMSKERKRVESFECPDFAINLSCEYSCATIYFNLFASLSFYRKKKKHYIINISLQYTIDIFNHVTTCDLLFPLENFSHSLEMYTFLFPMLAHINFCTINNILSFFFNKYTF